MAPAVCAKRLNRPISLEHFSKQMLLSAGKKCGKQRQMEQGGRRQNMAAAFHILKSDDACAQPNGFALLRLALAP